MDKDKLKMIEDYRKSFLDIASNFLAGVIGTYESMIVGLLLKKSDDPNYELEIEIAKLMFERLVEENLGLVAQPEQVKLFKKNRWKSISDLLRLTLETREKLMDNKSTPTSLH